MIVHFDDVLKKNTEILSITFPDNAQLARIRNVNQRIQARTLEAAEGIFDENPTGTAVELGRIFTNRQGQGAQPQRGRGGTERGRGRPTNSFKCRFTCLQDPNTEFSSTINHTELRRHRLGECSNTNVKHLFALFVCITFQSTAVVMLGCFLHFIGLLPNI